jgi:hypothetical protein
VEIVRGIFPEFEMDIVCVQTGTFEELDLVPQLTLKQPVQEPAGRMAE